MSADSQHGDLLQAAQGQLAHSEASWRELAAKAEAAARLHRFWQELTAHLERGQALSARSLLAKEKQTVEGVRDEDPASFSIVDAISTAVEQQASETLARYPTLLASAASNAGIPLDPDCRDPNYTFQSGFLHLDLDKKKGTARLSTREGRLGSDIPADIEPVVGAVLREKARLFDRPFNEDTSFTQLLEAYLATTEEEKRSLPFDMPIRQIAKQLAKGNKSFRADEFLIDLSGLVTSGKLIRQGYQLDLRHTKDTKEGMLLYGLEGQGYIGYLSFSKV